MRRTLVALIIAAVIITACNPEQPPAGIVTISPAAVAETAAPTFTSVPATTEIAQSAQCSSVVAQALTAIDTACQRIGRNQICYGNVQLRAEFNDGAAEIQFTAPGDIADLSAIRAVELSPLDADGGLWGLALMRVQANLPDTLPGQNVTFLLFGDVELENVSEETGIPSSFYFRTGIGDSTCSEAPSSGILVQTPSGVSEVTLRMNGVDIAIGSTAYLQAQPGSDMAISVIEGKAEIEAEGVIEIVTAGSRSNIPMSEDLNPAGPPSPAEPYDVATLQSLPVNNLERQISVESVLLSSDFIADAEGWTSVAGGTPMEHRAHEPASDGAICSTDGLFVAPQSWLGDRAVAFGGSLGIVARQEGSAPAEVILEGSSLSLSYTLPESFGSDWSALTIPLSDDAQWMNLSHGPAAAGELHTALSSLTALHIRGLGGCIDYIQLTAPTAPTTPYRRAAVAVPTAVTTAGTQQTFDIVIGDEIGPDLSQPGIGEVDGLNGADEYRFEAQAGQQVYFAARGEEGAVVWALIAPDGTVIFERWRLWQGNNPGIFTLPQAGTYTIRVTGESNRIGTYRFSLSEVGQGGEFIIAPDVRVFEDNPAPGAGHIENAGEQDTYTFMLDVPQDIYFAAMGEQTSAQWTLTGPDGEPLFEDQRLWQGNDPGAFALEAGQYRITVTGRGDSIGTYQFSVWRIPPPQSFTLPLDMLVSDGVPQDGMGRIESPGAQDIYTLELAEAAELRFAALGEDTRASWTLTAPDGTPLFEDQRLWAGNNPGVFTLEPGAYTVTVRGDLGQTGAYQFSVTHVGAAEDSMGSGESILIETEGEIATPGQQFEYSFEASANQKVFLDIRSSELSSYWTLTGPDQTEIFRAIRSGVSSFGPQSLDQEGEYVLSISGYADQTGPYAFALWNVPAPDSFEILLESVIGPEIGTGAGQIETPGVQDVYTFEASAGQSIFIEVPEADFTAYWVLADQDGTQVFGGYRSGGSNIGLVQLERGGEYTMTISGYQAEVGTYRARIWEVPVPDTFEVNIGQTIAAETTGVGAGTIESPGARDIYTFEAGAGQSILVEVLETNSTVYWQITGPADDQIFSGYRGRDSVIGVLTLETGGLYTLTVSGYDGGTGSYRAKLWDVPQPDRFRIALGQSISAGKPEAGTGVIETPGVKDVYTFDAAQGRSIQIEVETADLTLYWVLEHEDGEQIFGGYRSTNSIIGPLTLERAGPYRLVVSGYDRQTGSYHFKISEP